MLDRPALLIYRQFQRPFFVTNEELDFFEFSMLQPLTPDFRVYDITIETPPLSQIKDERLFHDVCMEATLNKWGTIYCETKELYDNTLFDYVDKIRNAHLPEELRFDKLKVVTYKYIQQYRRLADTPIDSPMIDTLLMAVNRLDMMYDNLKEYIDQERYPFRPIQFYAAHEQGRKLAVEYTELYDHLRKDTVAGFGNAARVRDSIQKEEKKHSSYFLQSHLLWFKHMSEDEKQDILQTPHVQEEQPTVSLEVRVKEKRKRRRKAKRQVKKIPGQAKKGVFIYCKLPWREGYLQPYWYSHITADSVAEHIGTDITVPKSLTRFASDSPVLNKLKAAAQNEGHLVICADYKKTYASKVRQYFETLRNPWLSDHMKMVKLEKLVDAMNEIQINAFSLFKEQGDIEGFAEYYDTHYAPLMQQFELLAETIDETVYPVVHLPRMLSTTEGRSIVRTTVKLYQSLSKDTAKGYGEAATLRDELHNEFRILKFPTL